jgi:hypothetical protein
VLITDPGQLQPSEEAGYPEHGQHPIPLPSLRRANPEAGLEGRATPPAPELFAAVLPSLLAAIELQRDAGDLAQPRWPAWLLGTIEAAVTAIVCTPPCARPPYRCAAVPRPSEAGA